MSMQPRWSAPYARKWTPPPNETVKTGNSQPASAGGVSLEVAGVIGTAARAGVGLGIEMGNRGGMRRDRDATP